ncbi:MAG: ABC transporter permease [Candidatus Melainabacteria bacterium]|nr:ABC transporter permease [Candidatus Melainabacteria bacterium]
MKTHIHNRTRTGTKNDMDSDSRIAPWLYLLPLVVVVIVWYFYTAGSSDRQFIFSSPEKVLQAFVRLASTGELVKNSLITLEEAIAGFVLGTITGALIGLSLWYSRAVARVSRPYIAALGSIPIFSLAPMIITWFGIGLWSKIMLAFLSTVVVAIVQSYQGAVSVEPRYLRFMAVVGASRSQVFRFIVVPSSLIWVVNAMKLNIGLALLGAFIGEFISAEAGLGYMIVKASGLYDMATVLVGVFTLMVIALILSALVEALERRILSWKYLA